MFGVGSFVATEMPETASKSVYLVDPYSDPVIVRIDGRASFQNSACLRDFIAEMMKQGKYRFVLDFQHCTSMDSTFLGVLAGAAMQLKNQPGGSVVATRIGARNLELLRNLGLHRLLTVDTNIPLSFDSREVALECSDHTELENARLVLEAHENLIAADENNRPKFQDVLVFLKNRLDSR
jgi:anti-sigma B factor antagonist